MNCVNVTIRIKPSNSKSPEEKCLEIINDDPPILCILDRNQTYAFDQIFNENVDQNKLFNTIINPLVEKSLLGYNCTVFAYGQTGTGKTYTIGSDMKNVDGKNVGIIKRVFDTIFTKNSKDTNIDVEIAVCEIYQEKVYDLLGNNKTALSVNGFNVVNLTKTKVNDLEAAEKLLLKSCKRRHTGETKQNAWSSRSHAIFTIYLNVKYANEVRSAKLNLVDLAGCESVKKTGTQNNQFNEAVKINMGLLSIGQVFSALTSKKTCVPYRESMITRILRDSLSIENYITLIACVSQSITDIHETIQTLEFAVKAKKVKINPEFNILAEYPRSIASKYQNTALCDMKTPMKRPNQIISSTTVKRPKISSKSTNSTLCYNSERRSDIYTNIISPVTKTVINKLEDRFPQNAEFSMINSELYNTMRILVKQEVHLQTATARACSSPIINPGSGRRMSSRLQHQSPILCVSRDNISTDLIPPNEIFTINTSNDKRNVHTNLFIAAPCSMENKENILFEKTDESATFSRSRESPIFKIPELPNFPKKDTLIPTQPRRSLRLSIKGNCANLGINRSTNNLSCICACKEKSAASSSSKIFSKKKKSKFRLKKQEAETTDSDLSGFSILSSQNKSSDSLDVIDTSQEDIFYESTIKTFPIFAKRRSIRLSMRQSRLSKSIDNSRNLTRISTCDGLKEKKIRMHERNILKILNNGDVKQLQKLHTIGIKTAEQIYLYRKLNGPFNRIDDLKQILIRGKAYERFLTGNCLTFTSKTTTSFD